MVPVKVNFNLEVEEDGFPPISVETLNGVLLEEGLIRIDNTPFFVEGVAIGDKIKCCLSPGNNNYQFLDVVEESGNRAISIIFIEDSYKEEVYQYLKNAGCYCEYGEFKDFNMMAVEVDGKINYEDIENYLTVKESQAILSYAELCI